MEDDSYLSWLRGSHQFAERFLTDRFNVLEKVTFQSRLIVTGNQVLRVSLPCVDKKTLAHLSKEERVPLFSRSFFIEHYERKDNQLVPFPYSPAPDEASKLIYSTSNRKGYGLSGIEFKIYMIDGLENLMRYLGYVAADVNRAASDSGWYTRILDLMPPDELEKILVEIPVKKEGKGDKRMKGAQENLLPYKTACRFAVSGPRQKIRYDSKPG